MADTLFVSEFRSACEHAGCPFCAMSRRRTRRYLGSLLHEYTLAPDIHESLAASVGFCARHALLLRQVSLAEQGDGLGVGVLYETVVERLVERIGSAIARLDRSGGPEEAAAALTPEGECLACAHERRDEQYDQSLFLEDLTAHGCEGPLGSLYAASAGACVPHLRRLLAARPRGPVARWLLEHGRRGFQVLSERLRDEVEAHAVHGAAVRPRANGEAWGLVLVLCAGDAHGPAVFATPTQGR